MLGLETQLANIQGALNGDGGQPPMVRFIGVAGAGCKAQETSPPLGASMMNTPGEAAVKANMQTRPGWVDAQVLCDRNQRRPWTQHMKRRGAQIAEASDAKPEPILQGLRLCWRLARWPRSSASSDTDEMGGGPPEAILHRISLVHRWTSATSAPPTG